MVQYLPDHPGVLNAGNDVHGRTNAVGAGTATLAAPPQTRQVSTSMLNTRLSRRAQVIASEHNRRSKCVN